jgi:hypothetical protein
MPGLQNGAAAPGGLDHLIGLVEGAGDWLLDKHSYPCGEQLASYGLMCRSRSGHADGIYFSNEVAMVRDKACAVTFGHRATARFIDIANSDEMDAGDFGINSRVLAAEGSRADHSNSDHR